MKLNSTCSQPTTPKHAAMETIRPVEFLVRLRELRRPARVASGPDAFFIASAARLLLRSR